MHALLSVLLAGGLAAAAPTARASAPAPVAPRAPDLVAQVRALPGVVRVQEREAPRGYRFFVIAFRQPADHRHPGRGSFLQRLTLTHRDLDRPTVLFTSGYQTPLYPGLSEPAQIIDGNELSLEHRFFGPSRPKNPDWRRQLTIRQAAADQHRVIRSFRRLYDRPWISTGGSKGGMTATYHRRFYPGDVAGTVPYVAPNDADNDRDRYASFLASVGTPSCRDAVTAVQRRILGSDRAWFLDRLREQAAEAELTARIAGGVDQALEAVAVDLFFTFWQYQPASACADVPGAGASNERIWRWTEQVEPLSSYLDQGIRPFLPYFVQASAQLGWPAPYENRVADLLRYPGIMAAPRLIPANRRPARFDAGAMRDVDRWVRTRSERMLFVYGGNDPWGAEPFACGPRKKARQCSVHVVAGGTHGASIADLPPAERRRAVRQLRRWAGVAGDGRTAPRVPSLHRTVRPRVL